MLVLSPLWRTVLVIGSGFVLSGEEEKEYEYEYERGSIFSRREIAEGCHQTV